MCIHTCMYTQPGLTPCKWPPGTAIKRPVSSPAANNEALEANKTGFLLQVARWTCYGGALVA